MLVNGFIQRFRLCVVALEHLIIPSITTTATLFFAKITYFLQENNERAENLLTDHSINPKPCYYA